MFAPNFLSLYDFKSIGLVEETKTDILMKSAGLYRGYNEVLWN